MYNLEWLRANPQFILLSAISGSHAYGTNIPTSDRDERGVFILPEEAIFGSEYVEQINDTKNDIVYYELRRFLELTASNNPTILELLNTPEDCIIYKHPLFDKILDQKENFITKVCGKSFGGYAAQQIQKAKGLNKKQNFEKDRITRKTVLDFCYVPEERRNNWFKQYILRKGPFRKGQGTQNIKTWLKLRNLKQENCGLVALPHMHDAYALFYDEKIYHGIVSDEDKANDVCLSSVKKNIEPLTILIFNKDGYSYHCTEYREYQEWLEKRNQQRWTDVKAHGQMIDGKNMLHCRRLLEMAKEIAEGKGINVRRTNADYLLKIRKGEVPLQELIDWAEAEIKVIDQLFTNATLPTHIEKEFINNLLVSLRTEFYKINFKHEITKQ